MIYDIFSDLLQSRIWRLRRSEILKITVLRAQMELKKVLHHKEEQEFDVLSIYDGFRAIGEVLKPPEQIYHFFTFVGI